jgi:stage III sporulation protein AF
MTYSGIRALCVLSVICGAALSIIPDGGVKRVAEITCSAGLIVAILSPIKELDINDYAIESAKLMEMENQLSANAQAVEDRLNRLVIESEYETYIMDKANELEISLSEVEVEAQWSLEGLWMPYEVSIRGEYTDGEKSKMSAVISADLGIPYERQRWNLE